MNERFDAVIVGSGFGGSVMAYELANAGLRVCVLERGKAYPPGSFPRSPLGLSRNFWDPSDGYYGMYDVWSFRHSEALVASGLGGGSLIYANVLLRKPEAWFCERRPDGSVKPWPVSRADLDEHYDAVEEVLGAQKFPLGTVPYDQTRKTLAFRDAAQRLGHKWYLPNLAVTFANRDRPPVPGEKINPEYPNFHGVDRLTCRLCGECDTGCNYGSKNTLDHTYLSLAKNLGADIRVLCEVRSFRPLNGDGYEVEYVRHDPITREGTPHPTAQLPLERIACSKLVLAAGTLGTNYLLLKNAGNFPLLSQAVGHRYSTNGDLLTFAFRCQDRSSSPSPRVLEPSRGPVITSTIEVSHGPNGEPEGGFFLQDAGYPEFLGWILQMGDAPGIVRRLLGFGWRRILHWMSGDPQSEIDGDLVKLLGTCELSAASMPLLGMGRDNASGRIGLRTGKDGTSYLDNDWKGDGSAAFFETLTRASRGIAEELGGTFRQNPDSSLLRRIISVHPLGGCAMGAHASEGVVDSYGQVFNYPGFYIADGSVMPGPTGSNPSLTIAALARRFSHHLLGKEPVGRREPAARVAAGAALASSSPSSLPPIGIEFTETMRGSITLSAGPAGQGGTGSPFEFTVTISIADLGEMVKRRDHAGAIRGTARCHAISAEPMAITDGIFNLFVDQHDAVNTREMRYAFGMTATNGTRYFLRGVKTIRDDWGPDLWKDTTTLAFTVHTGASDQDPELGRGVLRISVPDLAKQLTTFRVSGIDDPLRKAATVARFGAFFAGRLYDTYGGIIKRTSVFDPESPARERRPLDAPSPEVHPVTTEDGTVLKLTRFRGGDKGPVLVVHGLGVSSQIFSIDTIRPNLVEYLVGRGFDVWLLDYRASVDLPYCHTQFTGDDVATKDYPAAVKAVLDLTGARSVQAVVHCFGASTFFMAMLAGLKGVRSAVVSQIATHARVPLMTQIKAVFHTGEVLEKLGVTELTADVDSHTGFLGRMSDFLLRFYPVHDGPRDSSAVSHRISFLYGQLYQVENLNQATYDSLHEMFGAASIASLKHLTTMIRHGHLVNALGEDVYVREPEGYPLFDRLSIPMLIIHGAQNKCWEPESTAITHSLLCARNSPALYERRVIPRYGHIDCIFGANAHQDVYPLIAGHCEHLAR